MSGICYENGTLSRVRVIPCAQLLNKLLILLLVGTVNSIAEGNSLQLRVGSFSAGQISGNGLRVCYRQHAGLEKERVGIVLFSASLRQIDQSIVIFILLNQVISLVVIDADSQRQGAEVRNENLEYINIWLGLPRWLNSKEYTCQCRRCRFDLWIGKW